ncbi:MAG TPA: ATP-binding protein, partial [Actinomycetota bacterium]
EDLDRVVFAVDERLAVFGNAVADLTHLVAELVENAVHFSPPEASVIIRTRPYLQTPGAYVLTVEDWGVGMRAEDLTEANDLLKAPRDVDLSVSQRLGLHVVARLAQRHSIEVALTPTPGCGVTAAVVLPPSLFAGPGAALDEVYADETEVPAEVLPAAVAASTVAPATDQPAPPNWPRAERWIDLTDDSGPESRSGSGSAGNGHGHGGDGYAGNGDQHPAAYDAPHGTGYSDHPAGQGGQYPAGYDQHPAGQGDYHPAGYGAEHPAGNGGAWPAGEEADWSGWWESSPDDLDGEPISPIAARPPLSERVQASSPAMQGPPAMQDPPGMPEPLHPRMAGPPDREGSPMPERAAWAVHSPRTHTPRTQTPSHPAVPAEAAPAHPVPAAEEAPAPAGPLLSRRVPQAHLAPELRRRGQEQGQPAGRGDASLPDATEARAALSRYQASRQAARAVVDENGAPAGRGDEAGPEPPSAGGWS